MKKILIALLLIIFICGCIQAPDKETSDIEAPEMGFEEPESEAEPEQVGNEFSIAKGRYVMFNNKKIKLIDLDFRNEITLSVDGIQMIFYQTKLKEIFQDLEITPLESHFDPEGENTYILVKIDEFKSEPNQYLIYKNQELTIPNKGKIVLEDVLTDNLKNIAVKVSNEQGVTNERIKKGETKEILGLKITNIYPRPRPIGYEKYTLIQVE